MKLIKLKEQVAQLGLSASRGEWWDIEDIYKTSVDITGNLCAIGVHGPEKYNM